MEQDHDFIDAGLSDEGRIQAFERQDLLNQMKLHEFVFISPHKRTVQTACICLATHPQAQSLTLKLVPQAKEVVIASAELPVPLSELRIHNDLLTEQYGVRFDYSLFETFTDPEHWWLELLTNQETKNLLYSLIEKHAATKSPYLSAVLECAEKNGGLVEPDIDLFHRA